MNARESIGCEIKRCHIRRTILNHFAQSFVAVKCRCNSGTIYAVCSVVLIDSETTLERHYFEPRGIAFDTG